MLAPRIDRDSSRRPPHTWTIPRSIRLVTFFSMLDDGTPNSVGLVFLFLGIGYAVLWYFEDRHLAAQRPPSEPGGGEGPG